MHGALTIPPDVLKNPRLQAIHKLSYAALKYVRPNGRIQAEDIAFAAEMIGEKVKSVEKARKFLHDLGLVECNGLPPKPQRTAKQKRDKYKFAAQMRKAPTPSEKIMRDMLEASFPGMFKTQVVIAGYIADFYCSKHKLAVEVDGASHRDKKGYDRTRDSVFASYGIRTLRVAAIRVTVEMWRDGVIGEVREWLDKPPMPVNRAA